MSKKRAGKRKACNTRPDKVLKQERFDSDGLWKDLINRFFWSLLKMILPELYRDADTSKKYKLLDKEFRSLLTTTDPKVHTNPHFADFVIEVPMKEGGSEWLIFHAEVQGRGGGDLNVRMYLYKSLIYVHYGKEPVALAIITEGHVKEDRSYAHSRYGTKVTYEYNNLVLADLNDEELQTGDNPFELALYAAKCALRAKEEHQKYTYLRTLTGLLTERGWSMEDKRDLAIFIERFLSLKDEALKEQYWEYRRQLSKEGKVMYVSFLKDVEEKKLKEKAKAEGKAEGKAEAQAEKAEMVRKLLTNGVSPDIIAQSSDWPVEHIRSLVR